jgi:hypothetical protein
MLGVSFAGLLGAAAQSSAGGTPVGPIEPVSGATQVAISVGTQERQTWWGYGWGCGSFSHATASLSKLTANVQLLCEDMGASVIRIFTPEHTTGCLDAYKPIWDLVKNHGIDTIFSSSYILTSAGGVVANASPTNAANGIHAVINGGINPTRWAGTLQNEPDSPANGNYTTYETVMRGHQQTFRNTLNNLGRTSVTTLGLEWRHPRTTSKGQKEYDDNAALGRVGAGLAIGEGCLHIYDKSPDENDFDQRYLTEGLGLWSTETGNMSSPSAVSRFMAGVNHGTVVELSHIGQATTDAESATNQSQKLIAASGTPRPWYWAVKALSSRLTRGTVMRLCTSDRAGTMVYASNTVRHIVIAGKRPDSKWLIAGCNRSGSTEQYTVTVPELVGQDAVFSGDRITGGGSVSSTSVNMNDGLLRFTLVDSETVVLINGLPS